MQVSYEPGVRLFVERGCGEEPARESALQLAEILDHNIDGTVR
jgi:hypothetical protein